MGILWINLVVVFLCSFLARYYAVYVTFPSITYRSRISLNPNKIFTCFALISLVLISGLRSNIGDTYFYKHTFEINDFAWDDIKNKSNIGFWIFQMILKRFSEDPQILIFISAAISNVLIILVFYKYSKLFELSTYVYITGGLFLVSMNGIRQVLTASLIFTGTKFIIEGNWVKYFLLVLFASTFHESALILIPIYFVVRFKAWSKATFLLLFFAIIIVFSYDKFSSVLFSAIEDSQYGHYKNFTEGGANILRVVVYGIPLLIAYFGKEKLRIVFLESDYFVNMALIGFTFMVISTQNWIFARFSIYFDLYQLILISWVVKVFREKDQKLIYYSLLICYFLFYYYEDVISLNIVYKSNFLQIF